MEENTKVKVVHRELEINKYIEMVLINIIEIYVH